MKKVFGIAAMLLALAACDRMDTSLPPVANYEGIPFSATISAENMATTKALAESGSTIEATWATGEEVALIYDAGGTPALAIAEVTGQTGASATISAILAAEATDGSDVTIIYPASAADGTTGNVLDNVLAAQDGTLTGTGGTSIAEKYDIRKGTGKLGIRDGEATVNNGTAVTLTNLNSIFKFTLQDLSGAAKSASEFKLSDGSGHVIATVTSTPAASELYVALPALATGTYWLNATVDGKPYIARTTVGTATTAGTYYPSTVKMATFGDVIKPDGEFYAAGTAGAVAMISYVGSATCEAAPYNHGLALALSDASGMKCKWKTSETDAGHTRQVSSSFKSESGLQYNTTHNTDEYPAFKTAIANNGTAAPTGCSAWFLASCCQWARMKVAAGSFASLTETAGLLSEGYWTSSERNLWNAWCILFYSGGWGTYEKDSDRNVRSCLAF